MMNSKLAFNVELEWRAKTLFSMISVINKCEMAWIGLFQSRTKFLELS